MFDEDAMPAPCDGCGEWYDFGDSRQGYQCDRCSRVFCGSCLPGSKSPRVCDGCDDADPVVATGAWVSEGGKWHAVRGETIACMPHVPVCDDSRRASEIGESEQCRRQPCKAMFASVSPQNGG